MKYVTRLREHFSKNASFSLRDIEVFFSQNGLSGPYARQMLHRLVREKKLFRITSGRYTFRDEMQAVGTAYEPYYYGLQDALSYHGLWDQETNPVVITPRRVRTGLRQFLKNNYVVRRIDRRLFFGDELKTYADFAIYVSDVEKTLIDFAYFKEPLDRTALDEMRQHLDRDKLGQYLKKCPQWLQKRVQRLANT